MKSLKAESLYNRNNTGKLCWCGVVYTLPLLHISRLLGIFSSQCSPCILLLIAIPPIFWHEKKKKRTKSLLLQYTVWQRWIQFWSECWEGQTRGPCGHKLKRWKKIQVVQIKCESEGSSYKSLLRARAIFYVHLNTSFCKFLSAIGSQCP